ncbi:uncharacterized protein LOC102809325 [Saccoglossus kowalevskii]|uniref:Uncharacterized protein LOC102809325 n=1 Tax=Saccoglossus kowalevskii TaxID=10224 RepID=A0ABM0LYR4_SACKO|nr:PREDICTED: uncharacterized protein LOC102809325 [Saccoglossus kowalevskii]
MDPIEQEKVVNDKMKEFKRVSKHFKPAELTVQDLRKAEHSILAYTQRQHFSDDFKALTSDSQRITCGSRLYKLDPVVKDGLIRVGGRLERAVLSESIRHPIVLPKDSPVSHLIIDAVHKSVGHLGRNAMLNSLRQKYWILCANTLVRRAVARCIVCRRYRAKIGEQKMADLPSERVTPDNPPFTHTGVDYFGPLEVRRGRCTVKRYGVVFTCMATRAVHLEVAYSMNTDSCVNALRRFKARRGNVQSIRSDNGTNLVGAKRELQEELNKWNHKKIGSILRQDHIEWRFNPPAGSHMGGIWERQIRTIRKILVSLFKEQTVYLNDEALQTLFCEVEAIINGRPISVVSEDPNDLEALTPNHLLLLHANQTLPPGVFEKQDTYVKRRWRQVQYLADVFWRRWLNEYLPSLQERQKWVHPRRNLALGDIVLVINNSVPRNIWPMGKVVEVMKDRRGLVRMVKVKTKTNVYLRPVDKLCLLLESDDADGGFDGPKPQVGDV